MDTLPQTVYQSPPRPARGRQLNTIVEEREEGSLGVKSDSEGDASDRTVVGRPAGWDPKLFVATSRKMSQLVTNIASSAVSDASSLSAVDESPANSSASDGFLRPSNRSSTNVSDAGTMFSDETCPSLASDPTSFATDSSRNSLVSSKSSSSRNRYPALLIPRLSWGSMDSPIKDIGLGMSPATKIRLSQDALASLPRRVPAIDIPPPSLGSSSSIASDSPCLGALSAPITPDLRQLEQSEEWGAPQSAHVNQSLEIAIDEHHSIVLSPAEAHDDHDAQSIALSSFLSPRDREWGDIVVNFPRVPGGAMPPQSMQDLKRLRPGPASAAPSETGVHLPATALQTLARLTRERSPDSISERSFSRSDRLQEEMRERSEDYIPSHRRSLDDMTPLTDQSFSKLSDYSFTQLSIPSPGGFFSSLQSSSRHTWCLSNSKTISVPTSAIAENFYFNAFEISAPVKETVLHVDDTNLSDGPPTARQDVFGLSGPSADVHDGSDSPQEDPDLYGAGPISTTDAQNNIKYEYEEAYENELKHAAEVNLDRTGSWLAAQTSYLSVLRETNPANDPGDFPPSASPCIAEDDNNAIDLVDETTRKTVHFLEEAKAVVATTIKDSSCQNSPGSDDEPKEPVFHVAFENLLSNRKRRDAFLYASSRLEAVRSDRIALPEKHIKSLLGTHQLVNLKKPKYSGPFNQNPRATGIFERTPDQLMFEAVERHQRAIAAIQSSNWPIEALRTIYNGRLLACPEACDRLTAKAKLPLTDPACLGSKRHRILDFGGDSTASWAWHVAHEWPNVKVYTIISKEQAQSQRPPGEPKAAGPSNHRTVSVPHLWQLPFRSNHFDVVSARGLYALLKTNPVPEVPQIDEWDLTLRECMRVLKPGGYLDYMVMDSSIARAGPRGEAMSVEFGFALHRRGYERDAARTWLRRMKKEGFVGVKRAWMFLPMGRKEDAEETFGHAANGEFHAFRNGVKPFPEAPRPVSEVSTISKIVKQYMDVEAVQGPVGSTQDVADITGLLGARMWEQWLVKIRSEGGWEQTKLLEGIDEMIEEGRTKGSGWKLLVGWARKPRQARTSKSLRRSDIHAALRGDRDLSPLVETPLDGSEMGVIPMMIQG